MGDTGSDPGGPREVELKFECAGPDLTALAAHPLLHAAAEPELLTTTYFDTPSRDLRAAGVSLRVRASGGRRVQTVKAGGGGVGLFDRAEWENDVAGDAPEAEAWAGTAAEAILRDAQAPVERMFATVVMRRTVPVTWGGSRILVTIDEGRIESAAGDAALCELELEIGDGDPADLFGLAQALAETVPLRLAVTSKSGRGFALIERAAPSPIKAERVDLPKGVSAAEAFRRVARACLRHLRLNETVFLDAGPHPDALHQMRVSLRRLRSALSLFEPLLADDPRAAGFADEIKRITEPFGHARNLDVFLADTLPRLAKARPGGADLGEGAIEDLRRRAETERARAYDAVVATLQAPEWRGLLIDVAGWVETGDWAGRPEAAEDARDFAAGVLERARRRLKKRGRGLRKLDPHARHRARIAAKKLRYGAEFFADLYPKRKARRRHGAFADALADLQDHLGALNDRETAHSVVTSLSGPELPGADGAEADVAGLLDAAAKARAALLDVKPFWR